MVNAERRDQLLSALESAESEWGSRLETQLQAEADFLRTLIERRIGSAAVGKRVEDALAQLTVARVDEFLTGG